MIYLMACFDPSYFLTKLTQLLLLFLEIITSYVMPVSLS